MIRVRVPVMLAGYDPTRQVDYEAPAKSAKRVTGRQLWSALRDDCDRCSGTGIVSASAGRYGRRGVPCPDCRGVGS